MGDYFDAAGRLIAEADYGTTAVAAPAEPDPTVPSPSADVLLTTYGYDAAGNQNSVTDPLGIGNCLPCSP